MLFVDIEKCMGDFTLKVCFQTTDGMLSLLGVSGSGKSMTLKCIAGIEKPDRGKITLNDRVLFDSEKGINLPPQKRKVGYLFQQYALFPNMSVKQNIEVALHHLSKHERKAAVNQKLTEFCIEDIKDKRPIDLSGGEQQRTALARIMANNPEVLLLDEPFSAMDNHLKWKLLADMKKVISEYDKDVIFVTHDVDEVIALSKKICILNNGSSEEILNIDEACKKPETVSTAKFFGCKNLSCVKIEKDKTITCPEWGCSFKTELFHDLYNDISSVGIFPEDIELRVGEDGNDELIPGRILQDITTSNGKEVILQIKDTDNYLCIKLTKDKKVNIGDYVQAYLPPEKLLLLKE